MKTAYLVAILAIVALTEAQRQYRPFNAPQVVRIDSSGAYRPASDGSYTPDNSGSYKNNDGKYRPDDAGKYVHKEEKYTHQDYGYKHQADKFGNAGGNAGGSGGGANAGTASGNTNTGSAPSSANINLESGQPTTAAKRPHGIPSKKPVTNGFSAASGFGQGIRQEPGNGHIPGLGQGQGASYYGDNYDNRNYKIIRKIENVEQDGYHYLYETENGITGEEQGKLGNVRTDEEGMKAHGFYTYTGPDNVVYTVRYTADENGFVPEGDHLPTPPPIPAAILRALEYQRSIGTL